MEAILEASGFNHRQAYLNQSADLVGCGELIMEGQTGDWVGPLMPNTVGMTWRLSSNSSLG
jgi:hypothetical protein